MYAQVTWAEKQRELDGFVAVTGYNRKHAIVLLNGEPVATTNPPVRVRKYDDADFTSSYLTLLFLLLFR